MSDLEKSGKIKDHIRQKRDQWRLIRGLRINKKNELLLNGMAITDIRKEKHYRGLKKRQKQLSKEIRHLEKNN